MKQRKLTAPQRNEAESVARCLRDMIEGGTLGCGESYWKEAHDRLQRMYRYGTTDGEPWVEPVTPQSIDSYEPEFVLPGDWHGRPVVGYFKGDAFYGATLIGVDVRADQIDPYCVMVDDRIRWVENIRFTDRTGTPEPEAS